MVITKKFQFSYYFGYILVSNALISFEINLWTLWQNICSYISGLFRHRRYLWWWSSSLWNTSYDWEIHVQVVFITNNNALRIIVLYVGTVYFKNTVKENWIMLAQSTPVLWDMRKLYNRIGHSVSIQSIIYNTQYRK